MTKLDIDRHVVVLRETGTGRPKHTPLRDLVEELESAPLRQLPGPDPRIESLNTEVSILKERVSALGNGSPSTDPRIDDLIERVVFIEKAIKSLVVRALSEAEA